MDLKRCDWCVGDSMYEQYHNEEWGVPVTDDRKHFEMLILEAAQAGLSWLTILRKRANYTALMDNFDPEKIARYNEADVQRLMGEKGIVRNRLKIQSAIQNARSFLEIQEEFGSYNRFIWDFVDGRPVINTFQTLQEVPAKTALSDQISRTLKKRGFQFVGSTIIYAYLQATGIVMDHLVSCHRYEHLSKEQNILG